MQKLRQFKTQLGFAGYLGGLVACAGMVSAQGASVPDAQVEANVLRQLASAQELSTQNIQTSTVYGTVTLTGNVHDEAMRSKAENLAARAQGVKKVVDELTLGDTPAPVAGADQGADPNGQSGYQTTQNQAPGSGQVLQSDGTYAPASGGDANQQTSQGAPGYGDPQASTAGQQPYPQQGNSQQPGYPQQPSYPGQSGYSNQPQSYPQPPSYPGQQPTPPTQPGYPAQQSGYEGNQQQAYGNAPPPPPPGYGSPRQPMYPNGYAPSPNGGPQGGQVGGQQVTVPSGSILRVRVDRGFDANHVQAGAPFTGIVMQDVVANGAIAIPRGASVQGSVVDAKKAGVFKGEAQLGLQITNLTLGGQQYALTTDVWQREGRDKTVGTVNSALGLGAVGAILGGVAGGGAGAAIGAGVGGAAGVAGSAASPSGRVIVPPESVLTFALAQPTNVITVGQAELSRLSYAAGPGPRPVPPRRYYGPYGYYYR